MGEPISELNFPKLWLRPRRLVLARDGLRVAEGGPLMQPRISVVTLGVSDLGVARKFYCDGLGWTAAPSSNQHVVFIDAGAVVLALFGRSDLAKDAHVRADGQGFGGITLAHNVGSKAEVDATIEFVRKASATILKEPADTFWGGYSGYFADPDGYPWEVAWNPFWPLDANGRVQLPKF